MPNQSLQNSRVDLLSTRNLDFKGRKIQNAGDGTLPQDYVTLAQIQSLGSGSSNSSAADISPWVSYVPVTVASSGGLTLVSTNCAYKLIGKSVLIRMSVVVTMLASTSMTISLPTVPVTDDQTFAFTYINPTNFTVGAAQAFGAGPVVNLYPTAGGSFGAAALTAWVTGVYETT